jgi:DNA-binding transcriptional LysR family regulator
MDLRKLRHAVILAEEGSFARAARRLNLTQPALTRSIQSLEALLGLRLFDRSSAAGVTPTNDGRRVLEHARSLLRQEASLLGEAALLARGETGRVAFGLGPMLTPTLGPVLSGVLSDGARLNIRVEIEAVHTLEHLLLDGRIDFFIADGSRAAANPQLQVDPIRTVPAGFFVRAGHPLAGGTALEPDDLAPWPLASPALDAALGYSPAQVIACEDCHALTAVVLASDAVMIGMSLSVRPELESGAIVKLRGDALPFDHARVSLVRQAARTLSAGARRIVEGFTAALATA